MANTAVYDSISKCIKLPSPSSDGGAFLEGSIIEMEAAPPGGSSPHPFGRMLMGEIMEIVIMDENMQPLAVFDETSSMAQHNEALLMDDDEHEEHNSHGVSSVTREELIQKQREQQQLHLFQSQELLKKHQVEKGQLYALEQEGRLSRENKSQLSAEMEETHQQELMELQVEHNREQSDLMDLIFESASSSKGSKGSDDANSNSQKQSKWKPKTKQKPQAASGNNDTADNSNRSTIVRSNSSSRKVQKPQPVNNNEAPEKNNKTSAGLWSRAAVATVSAGSFNQNHREEEAPPVAAANNNNTAANTTTPQTSNAKNKKKSKSLEKRKQEELKAVMRDRHIPPNERLKKMTEIRDKYSDMHAQAISMSGDDDGNANAASSGASSSSAQKRIPQPQPSSLSKKSMEELRREEVQSVMKDKALGREEKQRRLAAIKAKYATLAYSSRSAAPPIQAKQPPPSSSGNNRWNKAAVFAVAGNTMTHQGSPPREPQQQQQQEKQSQQHSPTTNLWKKGAVSALSANNFNADYKTMKQEQGSHTPMSVFIQKVESNDPSLTALVLDGRKDVSDDEWNQLFTALENNSILTHLSVSNCGLEDDAVVPLVLALVENETLTSLNLSKNRGLTSGTWKTLLKVLKQSNPVIKIVNTDGTKISTKMTLKIRAVLDDRDETKQMEKLQAARQKKITELLAFSASDVASPGTQRLSQRLLEVDNDDDVDVVDGDEKVAAKSVAKSGRHVSSGGSKDRPKHTKSVKGRAPQENRRRSTESLGSSKASVGSGGSSNKSGGSGGRKTAVTGSTTNGGRRKPRKDPLENNNSSVRSGSTAGHGNSVRSSTSNHANKVNHRSVRSSQTAHKMASLGGETASGKCALELGEGRKLRGECEHCGQKLFQKTMFKTTPVTVPNKVFEGRCLLCNPM